MAWSPESHGIIERVHVEFHRVLGKSVEVLAEARAEDWPDFVPLVELTYRTRTLETGAQPLALSRGFYGSTPLQSALGALRDIPAGLAHSSWMKTLSATHKLICASNDDLKEDLEMAKLARADEAKKIRPRVFRVGDYVLLTRGLDERLGSKMGAQGHGPWKISAIKGDAVNLEDPWSGRPIMDGGTGLPDDINVDRLLRHNFIPADLDLSPEDANLLLLAIGRHIAFINRDELLVGEVRKFVREEWVEADVLRVPAEKCYGGLAQRPWEEGAVDPVKVLWKDVVTVVELAPDRCVTVASLEKLRSYGAEL